MLLVQRLAAQTAAAMPSVSGMTPAEARRSLADLDVSVVSFGRGKKLVSAQWPPAGEPKPADGAVVVWIGTPPPPPPPPPAAKPRAPGTQIAAVATAPAPAQSPMPPPRWQPPPAAAPALAAAPAPPVGGPGSGITPGLETFVAPPHGPRANIRTLAPASPGTTLAGPASWYGPGFEGRGTACGTAFDPAALTLASRELRCGTNVTVTGPNGSVEATVSDWGPAEWTQRRFDLSQATFGAVASLGSGEINVTVEVR